MLISSVANQAATLPRSIGWRAALVIAVGASVQVVIAVGLMAQAIGGLSLVAWGVTALVGALQCLLLVDLARRNPDRAGGTATYAAAAFPNRPLVGAISGWAYWFAWTPGIAVNVLFAAEYLQAAFIPGVSSWVLGAIMLLVLYGVNLVGLATSIRSSVALAVCAVLPLLLVALAPFVQPGMFVAERVAVVPGGVGSGDLLKWMFVAAWSAYGAEMVSSVVAELRDPERSAGRALRIAGMIVLGAFVAIPAALLGLVGAAQLGEDPTTALLPAAEAVVGPWGAALLTLLLVSALLLGAYTFLVSSSRTIYQMSQDGLLPRFCGRVNRNGVPVGSLLFDLTITLVLLAIFQTALIDVVAAANVPYLVVFILLPLAWLRLCGAQASIARRVLAWSLLVFNAFLLVFGGVQWGFTVMGVGVVGTLLVLPLLWWRRRTDRRRVAVQ